MTIRLADARTTPEAVDHAGRLAFKTATQVEGGQLIALDDAEGIITAIVSVTGVEDDVADIIVPGAYRDTLTKRRPKVCWAHSWEKPIGRVLHIEELLPGDERLPAQTKEGAPWPAAAGALVATMQFNMKSAAGREAFEAARFYSETGECEYSIGYQVPPGKSARDKAGTRHIKALELYELSVVLFGAHPMTGTLSIKQAAAMAREGKHLTLDHYDPDVDWDLLTKALPETPDDSPMDFSDSVMVAVYPDPDAATRLAAAISGPDNTTPQEELHVTLAYLGKTTEVAATDDDIVRRLTDALEGFPSLAGELGGIGMFPADENAGDEGGPPVWVPVDVPMLSLLREQIAGALGDLVVSDHGFTPHMTIGYGIGMVDPIPSIPVRFSEVRVVWGTQDRRIPLGPEQPEVKVGTLATGAITAQQIKDSAITAQAEDGTAGDDDADLDSLLTGFSDGDWFALIAEDEPADEEVKAVEALMERKATTPGGRQGDDSPIGTPGGKENWVDQTGGLPRYIRMVAHALIRKGMAVARAIATAVNTIKRWARGGGNVSAKVQAAAAKALAEWEANKAEARADNGKGLVSEYDPAYERKQPVPADGKGYPRFPGTFEARQDAVRAAVNDALLGEPVNDEGRREWDYVSIEATWADRVIVTREQYRDGADNRETFEMPYTYDPESGVVDLGSPEPVELQIVTVPLDGEEPDEDEPEESVADAMPLAEDVWVLASRFRAAHMQTKAGRVLSGANERRLRQAVETLLAVLAAAGVEIDPEGATVDPHAVARTDPRREVDPRVDLESTAPAAQAKGADVVIMDPAQIVADLARLGLAAEVTE